MAKKLKPYEVSLESRLAEEILNIPMDEPDAIPPRTVGERLQRAIQAVEDANRILASSPLAAIVADTLMRQLKKRGTPSIVVRPDGVVILRVSYTEEPVADVTPNVQLAKRTSNIPTMDELREKALLFGVDISGMGRQRRAIWEKVQKAQPF